MTSLGCGKVTGVVHEPGLGKTSRLNCIDDRYCRTSRRECLRRGGLALFGLNTVDLARWRALGGGTPHVAKHRKNSCVFIFLFGGPSHIDLWDMKPDAPAEIRGEFKPVSTNVPGIDLCEHLPRLARQMDKVCLLRSMTHKMNVHGPACSEIYSGREYFGPPLTDQATPDDWPSLASMVTRFGSSSGGLPPAAVLPWYTQFVGQDRRIAGQTGGRMGDQWNPFLIQGDPSRRDFEVQGVRLPEHVSGDRFRRRQELFSVLDRFHRPAFEGDRSAHLFERHRQAAIDMIAKAQGSTAFDIGVEPEHVRRNYGPTKFGQSLLLARRLIENGIPLVTVNWDDGSRFDKVSPHWDTHHNAFRKLRDGLCPVFDQAFAAFLADLHQRGLLESTLVVALGEFGRTPRIGLITQNGMTQKTGRDHWPHAFTAILAGGGIRGGQAYGSTIGTGGYVLEKPVSPADLTATILYHLGVDPAITYLDGSQHVSRRLCDGTPILGLS